MKYRGNFDVDDCERQFEKRQLREAHRVEDAKFTNLEGRSSDRKRSTRERARNRKPWQQDREK